MAKDAEREWPGGCRCGRVRFSFRGDPLLTMACHCTGCQRMTGSAFSLSVGVWSERFEVTAGEPVVGGLHGATRHFHCPHCMSWLFTRPEGMDWLVNVRTTMLDDPEPFAPFIETFTAEKLPYASVDARRSFARFPEMADYEKLTEAFAAEWATRS